MSVQLEPLLKYPGGKRWLLPRLRKLWAPHSERRLVEPFVGGMSVALGLQPRRALLNDLNPAVVNLYRWVKRGLERQIAFDNTEAEFYALRENFNGLLLRGYGDTAEAAEAFYLLNRSCYNGLIRFSRNGFNSPWGKYKNIICLDDFSAYRRRLRPWRLENRDFADLRLEDEDFVYADPPYDSYQAKGKPKRSFVNYSAEGFTWEDQVRLAERLAAHAGQVVISNHATNRIIRLYRSLGFRVCTVDAPRAISCNGDRRKAREVLALKNV